MAKRKANIKLAALSPAPYLAVPGVKKPERAQFHFVRRKGIDLRVCLLESKTKSPRGSVILVPGRTEFIEKYLEVAADMRKRGFAVIIFDHRGQGLSSRILDDPLKSYVAHFSDYAKDLKFLIERFAEDLPRPHVLLGHSMGGAVAAQAMMRGYVSPDCAVLNAPMLGIVGLEQPGIPTIISIMSALGFSRRPIPMQPQSQGLAVDFEVNKLTSDPKRYEIWRSYFDTHENARVAGPTYGWIAASVKGMNEVKSKAGKLQTPTMIVQPLADPIVVVEDVAEFAKKADVKYVPVKGALHETLMERDIYRSQFFAAFDDFLEEQEI